MRCRRKLLNRLTIIFSEQSAERQFAGKCLISDAASLMAGGFRAGEIFPDGDEAMFYNDCACPIRHGMHVFRAIVRHHVSILRKER